MAEIIVQRIVSRDSIPSSAKLESFAQTALPADLSDVEIGIRIVDKLEMTQLNLAYRKKDKPTNILSFPMHMPPMLGDLVACAEVIEEEANAQKKSFDAHWAHMIIHGVLHLQGYDHETEQDAEQMEALEIKLLAQLGFANPYQIVEKGE